MSCCTISYFTLGDQSAVLLNDFWLQLSSKLVMEFYITPFFHHAAICIMMRLHLLPIDSFYIFYAEHTAWFPLKYFRKYNKIF